MSTTQTTTNAPSKDASPPEYRILTRVATIPMIASGLETIDCALTSNTFTRLPYSTAKDLSKDLASSAYKHSEPLQKQLAPLINHADVLANKAVDAVEQRYPYPFNAKPGDVADLMRERKKNAEEYVTSTVDVANKKLDEKIKTPAYNVAQGIDQSFAPIVDYFQTAVSRLSPGEAGPSNVDAKYQYQRAYNLSKCLKDNIYVYSNEQFHNLHDQNALIQRATKTAESITELTTSSIANANTRVHNLSESMVIELQKLHNAANSFTASIQSSVRDSTTQIQNQIPPQIQKSYTDLTNNLSASLTELRKIMATDMPLQDKVGRIGQQVQCSVSPVLEAMRNGLSELMARGKGGASKANNAQVNGVNGSGPHGAN
ncbi:lipid droplet-associated perilipin protein [Lyophyllum atratum]|nr:lipid droplet-associated perilipin protein [Lyophyllum atratum]